MACALALLSAGCVTALTPSGAQVRVVGDDLRAVKGCEAIRQIRVESMMVGLNSPQGQENNLAEMRNIAAEAGANVLVYTDNGVGINTTPVANGTAYRCP
jgi:hypothetical protein